ncbi:hypothetical protein GALL_356590 [mine drainage metagenome]|uniref:Protein containing DUF1697 n=1 Tax=mine drainage metagenome TaxID=410659 RepID=A0A1J5QGH1_9ZZZZ
MGTWIALLKGVNVGGKHILPMKTLVTELETLGLTDVKTYIQSGNIVFRDSKRTAATLASEIGRTIEARFGFDPHVVVISHKDFASAVAGNPFRESVNDENGKTLHLFFLDKTPLTLDQDRLKALIRPSERWHLEGRVFYLYTPEGFGDSKLASQVEKVLGVSTTARNWRTVCALLDLADPSD